MDDITILVSDNILQRCHAVSATLLHVDSAGGTGPFPRRQSRPAAQESVFVPVHAGVHIHGSDHQPGQGEFKSTTTAHLPLSVSPLGDSILLLLAPSHFVNFPNEKPLFCSCNTRVYISSYVLICTDIFYKNAKYIFHSALANKCAYLFLNKEKN